MKCTSPLYRVNNVTELGAKAPGFVIKRKIVGYKDYLHFTQNLGVNPLIFTKINCGQCLSCRIQHAKIWAERCLLESQDYKSNMFITFTYDDNHLHYNELGYPVLYKKDMQDFFKRLRQYLARRSLPNVRYFCAGEYGENSFRPHYHAIIFGLDLPDLKVYKVDKGTVYYNSEILQELWQNKGFCVIGKVCAETVAYTARYSLKKLEFPSKLIAENNLSEKVNSLSDKEYFYSLIVTERVPKPFLIMSRRPGIARNYYDRNKELIYENDYVPGSKIKHIRYFDKLFEEENPYRMIDCKTIRGAIAEGQPPPRTILNEEKYLDVLRDYFKTKKPRRDKL